jgi:manganese transport protein
MGKFANPLWIKILASASAILIVVLNVKLVFDFFAPESWQKALGI